MQNNYFQELTINLRREQFAMGSSGNDLLPIEWNSQPLCRITANGGGRHQKEDVAGESRSRAMGRVIDIAKTTIEYMRLMESTPHLEAGGLRGDYRLLADFNGIILVGHQTKYGVQFITWEWSPDGSFQTEHPNTKWVTNIFYIQTDERVLYLSMIRDLFDNSIIAYKTAAVQTVSLVLDTIRLALKKEKVAAGRLQLYSDQGGAIHLANIL